MRGIWSEFSFENSRSKCHESLQMPRNEFATDRLAAGALKGAPDTDGNALQVSTRLRFRVNVFDARRDRLPARHTNGGWGVLTSRVQQAG